MLTHKLPTKPLHHHLRISYQLRCHLQGHRHSTYQVSFTTNSTISSFLSSSLSPQANLSSWGSLNSTTLPTDILAWQWMTPAEATVYSYHLPLLHLLQLRVLTHKVSSPFQRNTTNPSERLKPVACPCTKYTTVSLTFSYIALLPATIFTLFHSPNNVLWKGIYKRSPSRDTSFPPYHVFGFFFMEKRGGGLRPCIDYYGLYQVTVKYC